MDRSSVPLAVMKEEYPIESYLPKSPSPTLSLEDVEDVVHEFEYEDELDDARLL